MWKFFVGLVLSFLISMIGKVFKGLNDTFQRSLSINDDSNVEMDTKLDLNNKITTKRADIMENLIDAINKIQDVFNTLKVPNSIELPQIVMLGSQSTGKSSVLESIVHRPFLPRGCGIVTRCPLVLQLVECKLDNTKYRKQENGTTEIEEWGEFLHLKDQIFSDFNKIREEIERRTDEIAGSNKGICRQPINLKIYSPNVVNLTLVDLPGIVKVPVGDQPFDIEKQIKNLIMDYIKNENSIILSVSCANVDIATSESLKYAKEVDKEGVRTLAILTKIDLMDAGTDAMDMLTGKLIPVKLGIIGVVNRSQQDINNNKTIDEQLKDEKIFLEENYKNIAYRNGIPYLSKRLSELLKLHIFKCLPDIKAKIDQKLDENQKIYEICGDEIKNYGKIKSKIIRKLTQKFEDYIDGAAKTKLKDANELCGGPQFCMIFDEVFICALTKIEPELKLNEIKQKLKSNQGARPSIFPSEHFIEKLIYEQIERLRNPSLKCVENVYDEMLKVLIKLIDEQEEFIRFPRLKVKIKSILKTLLDEQLPVALNSVTELIDTELSSINTNHPDFSIEEALTANDQENVTSNVQNCQKIDTKSKKSYIIEKIEKDAKMIENLVKYYFPIVKKTVQDQVPKIIMYKIINYMKNNMQDELSAQLDQENCVELMTESEKIKEIRENAKAMIKALKMAKNTIEEMEMGC